MSPCIGPWPNDGGTEYVWPRLRVYSMTSAPVGRSRSSRCLPFFVTPSHKKCLKMTKRPNIISKITYCILDMSNSKTHYHYWVWFLQQLKNINYQLLRLTMGTRLIYSSIFLLCYRFCCNNSHPYIHTFVELNFTESKKELQDEHARLLLSMEEFAGPGDRHDTTDVQSTSSTKRSRKQSLMPDFVTSQDSQEQQPKSKTSKIAKPKSAVGVKTSISKGEKLKATADKLNVQQALCREMFTVKVGINI